ncbi:hypothetical protein [Methanolobus sp. ZRKC5]|uniref:hypothetical protein n=1 Tax=unclassified Methanolobus TaxID=2629569 RepID=UPI00313C6416
MKVAIADCREYSGTCALWGCIPKKVLAGVASIIDAHNRMLGKGTGDSKEIIDWPALIDYKNTFTDPHPEQAEDCFKAAGINTYHGIVRFENEPTLQFKILKKGAVSL